MINLDKNPAISPGLESGAIPSPAGKAGTISSSGNGNEVAGGLPSSGIHVDLSPAGRTLSAAGSKGNANGDIDDSDLPDQIKQALKRIREIRAELQKKQRELQEVMADTRMKPDQRKMRVAMLQSEVMSLTAALHLASNALAKLMNELDLSAEQAMTAGQLMMA
ncbi:hypothetical protein H0A70_04390 [Alcaligenaceae bacterium]|nr:hypothetical protein [Alcaligenaceae bacterium]